jgi:hypothetical protein
MLIADFISKMKNLYGLLGQLTKHKKRSDEKEEIQACLENQHGNRTRNK